MSTEYGFDDMARSIHEEMSAEFMAHGIDIDDEFVSYVELEEGVNEVIKKGSLMDCIKCNLKLYLDDDNEDAQITTEELFSQSIISRDEMH